MENETLPKVEINFSILAFNNCVQQFNKITQDEKIRTLKLLLLYYNIDCSALA